MKLNESRAEFCLIFRSFFGQWSFKKKCFWDLLTSSHNFQIFGIKSLSFGKIYPYRQDQWGISANVNNFLDSLYLILSQTLSKRRKCVTLMINALENAGLLLPEVIHENHEVTVTSNNICERFSFISIRQKMSFFLLPGFFPKVNKLISLEKSPKMLVYQSMMWFFNACCHPFLSRGNGFISSWVLDYIFFQLSFSSKCSKIGL